MTMPCTNLGSSGLQICKVGLGCMNFGWLADKTESIRLLDEAEAEGVNFFDTANVYGGDLGNSEEILGSWARSRRERVVIATKGGRRVGNFANSFGSGRKHLYSVLHESLTRMRIDYIDLYQIHEFDPTVPIEETLATLNDFVRQGKVRHVGISNIAAWQLTHARHHSRAFGLEPLVSVQCRYNLLHRGPERELLPAAAHAGVGVIAYNPLAGGLMVASELRQLGVRFQQEGVYRRIYLRPEVLAACVSLRGVARDAGVSLRTLALQWLHRHPNVTAFLLGPKTTQQLRECLDDLREPSVNDEVFKRLDETYRAHFIATVC